MGGDSSELLRYYHHKMNQTSFTLRSEADLLATFREKDQDKVVFPKGTSYPFGIQHYFTWTDPSGVYTYLVFKRHDWETPIGLALQRNGEGNSMSPAGMCDWCHHFGPSDQVGLLSVIVNSKIVGGTWLCVDLSCIEKALEQSTYGKRSDVMVQKQIKKICSRIGEFYQRVMELA